MILRAIAILFLVGGPAYGFHPALFWFLVLATMAFNAGTIIFFFPIEDDA